MSNFFPLFFRLRFVTYNTLKSPLKYELWYIVSYFKSICSNPRPFPPLNKMLVFIYSNFWWFIWFFFLWVLVVFRFKNLKCVVPYFSSKIQNRPKDAEFQFISELSLPHWSVIVFWFISYMVHMEAHTFIVLEVT